MSYLIADDYGDVEGELVLAGVHQRRGRLPPPPQPHPTIALGLGLSEVDGPVGAEDVLEAVARHQRSALHPHLRRPRRPRHGEQVGNEHVTVDMRLVLHMTDFL